MQSSNAVGTTPVAIQVAPSELKRTAAGRHTCTPFIIRAQINGVVYPLYELADGKCLTAALTDIESTFDNLIAFLPVGDPKGGRLPIPGGWRFHRLTELKDVYRKLSIDEYARALTNDEAPTRAAHYRTLMDIAGTLECYRRQYLPLLARKGFRACWSLKARPYLDVVLPNGAVVPRQML